MANGQRLSEVIQRWVKAEEDYFIAFVLATNDQQVDLRRRRAPTLTEVARLKARKAGTLRALEALEFALKPN